MSTGLRGPPEPRVEPASGPDALREELKALARERNELVSDLHRARLERTKLAGRVAFLEDQNASLLNLHAASTRLWHSLQTREGVSTILEIVMNLVGCDQVALFDVKDGDLVLRRSMGVDAGKLARIPRNEGLLGHTAGVGTTWLHPAPLLVPKSERERELHAAVPLVEDGKTIAVLALFAMLPQKGGFTGMDAELLELISVRGAAAMRAAG